MQATKRQEEAAKEREEQPHLHPAMIPMQERVVDEDAFRALDLYVRGRVETEMDPEALSRMEDDGSRVWSENFSHNEDMIWLWNQIADSTENPTKLKNDPVFTALFLQAFGGMSVSDGLVEAILRGYPYFPPSDVRVEGTAFRDAELAVNLFEILISRIERGETGFWDSTCAPILRIMAYNMEGESFNEDFIGRFNELISGSRLGQILDEYRKELARRAGSESPAELTSYQLQMFVEELFSIAQMDSPSEQRRLENIHGAGFVSAVAALMPTQQNYFDWLVAQLGEVNRLAQGLARRDDPAIFATQNGAQIESIYRDVLAGIGLIVPADDSQAAFVESFRAEIERALAAK